MYQITILLTVVAVFVAVTLGSRYPIVEIPERIDADGQRWVGPLPLRPVGATDDELNKWTIKVIDLLKPTIAKGFPEYNFPSVDPFHLKKFDYEQKFGPVSINIAAKDIRIEGFSEFNKLVLTFDTKNRTMRFHFEVPDILINCVYKAGGSAVLFPITGSGPALVKIANLRATGYMGFSVATREDGVQVVQVDKTVVDNLKFGGLNARIRGLFNGNPVLSPAFHYFANNYGPQIFEGLLKRDLSTRIAEMVTQDVVNPFIYNIPQFVPYIQN